MWRNRGDDVEKRGGVEWIGAPGKPPSVLRSQRGVERGADDEEVDGEAWMMSIWKVPLVEGMRETSPREREKVERSSCAYCVWGEGGLGVSVRMESEEGGKVVSEMCSAVDGFGFDAGFVCLVCFPLLISTVVCERKRRRVYDRINM